MGREKLYAVLQQANDLLESIENKEDKKFILMNMLLFRKTVYELQTPSFNELSVSDVKEHVCSVLQMAAQKVPTLRESLWIEPRQIPLQEQTLLTLYYLFQQLPVCDQKVDSSDFIVMFEMMTQLYMVRMASNEFYTPRSIVRLIVTLTNPTGGAIYDPCYKNAAILIAVAQHLSENGAEYEMFGQEQEQNAWKLAQMLMYLFSVKANLGKAPNDVFINDLHPDLRADYVLGNPPFRSRNWGRDSERVWQDPRWKYGLPSKNNGDYAWLQHMLYHAKKDGKISAVLTVSALYRENSSEIAIRRNMINDDIIEAIITLPKGLFYGTQVATAIWMLNKEKSVPSKHKILFLDGSTLGTKDTRIVTLSENEIQKIVASYQAYINGEFVQEEGFCKTASIEEVAASDYTLLPNHYISYKKEILPSVSELEKQKQQLQMELRDLISANSDLLDHLLNRK